MDKQPDLERARQYALDRLEKQLSPRLVYHSLEHTRDDVEPAVERLAQIENIAGIELLLVQTAAYYHDIGYIYQREDHERVSAELAGRVLPIFGYSFDHIRTIQAMIMVTRLPQSPHTLLEEILADADLDSLGRMDCIPKSFALRAELEDFGVMFSDEQWFTQQLKFFQSHQYFTRAAHQLRDEGKRQNIEAMRELLDAEHRKQKI
jgi:uncharacterized protein